MIFVTGGTGLVGSQLLYDLASGGKRVRALRRRNSDMLNVKRLFENTSFEENIEWVEGDVTDVFSLDDAMQGVDTVYHSAAFISFHSSDISKIMKINVDGSANMINMALKNNIKRYCHVSSVAALGRNNNEKMFDENSWWNTSKENSNYSVSKYGGEREAWRGMEEGLHAFIINPSIIIGPGNWSSGSSQMFSQIWEGMPFYTSGVTGFVDVRDVSRAATMLMDKNVSNERYVINSENISYRSVFDMIAENIGRKKSSIQVSKFVTEAGWRLEKIKSFIVGKSPMITKETSRSGHKQWYYSNEKIKKEIDIDFIPIAQSVKDTCEWFMQEKSKSL